MPVIEAGSVRQGNVIKLDEDLWLVRDTREAHVGKKGAYTQIKMQNLRDNHTETKRFSTSDRVETAYVETKWMTYLYEDTAGHVFMEPETGQQVMIDREKLEDVLPYLAYNAEVEVDLHDGRPISVKLPTSVELEVTSTEPAVRGDTATNVTKPAEVETGCTVKVPGHIKEGEVIEVDTRTGEFLGRA
ncbi:MAG: elongation factor P [Planctomycetota bacterium]